MSKTGQGCRISNLDKNESEDNFDACTCKVEQALSLILGEIKKIDAIIHRITNSTQNQEFLPTIEEKKEFVKSLNKNNNPLYRVIIDDLKKQRCEINEMQECYNLCIKEFSKLKENQNKNCEQIEQIKTSVDEIQNFLANLEKNKNKKDKIIDKQREEFKIREKYQEKLFKEMVEWILKLNENKLQEEKKESNRILKLESERIQDRAMLICVVKQIQEVNQIKNSIEDASYRSCNEFSFEKLFHSKSSEFEIQENVTEFDKINSEKSISQIEKRKKIFPKIFDKNREENRIPNSESLSRISTRSKNYFLPKETYGCQNPIFLGPYNSVQNYLSRKDIPFYLKLIGRMPERNKVKFIKIGNRYFSVE